MQLGARLLLLVRKEVKRQTLTMAECLTVQNFDTVAKCAILACGENEDSELEHPSVAIKLGLDNNKLVTAKIGYAAKSQNEDEYKDAKRSQSLLKAEWKLKVRKHATVLLEERRFNRRCELPDPEDIGKLAKYLTQKLTEYPSMSAESPGDY